MKKMPSVSSDSFLREAVVVPFEDFNPSHCSIKCAVRYVLEPVVTHAPGCPSAPVAVSVATGSTPTGTENSTTKEPPIAED